MLRKSLIELADDSVRALAWCIGGPSLLATAPGLELWSSRSAALALERDWEWLRRLDRDPSELHRHLETKRTWKVGLHFEALLEFWLDRSPHHELLAHNLPVREEGRTLGALDFLVRDAAGAVQHWEVAVKFYLQHEPSDVWSAWIGPNKRDRLDLKLDRMRSHQIPLSSRPEAEPALSSLQITTPPEQLAVVKGMLFVHWASGGAGPKGAESQSPMGHWVRSGEFRAFAPRHGEHRWCVRQKPDWLGPARRTSEGSFSTDDALRRLQTGHVRPELWSRLKRSDAGLWLEDQRVFVVPDAW